MPKIKCVITTTVFDARNERTSCTFIVEAPTALSAMAKFSAAANTMPYTGPVTDEPSGDPDGKSS